MKLSTRVVYSLRVMIYLADHAGGKTPASLKEIAEAQGLPFKYLEQLMGPLRAARLVKSLRGKQGGYTLGRPAGEITALDVVEAAAGPVELIQCTAEDAACGTKELCASRRMWVLLESSITGILSEHTLEDLSEKDLLEKFTGAAGEKNVRLKCME